MSEEKAFCRTDDLAIGYGKTPLMEHIRLGAEKGSILTLIGPNGAGKSTLLKTLAAQLAPQGGAVLLDGKSLADYSGPERARKMALMVPHTRRTELTTCFEMASAGRYPYTGRLGVLSAEDRRQVHAALALVGAEALAGRDFNCISDGQRQRVLLARAICQQPELILLDEPTSFLDIKGKAELLAILKSLARDKKMAVILSLHELELAQKISDKVVCVSAAGVSDVMTPGQAFARENICKIYDLSDEQYAFLYGEAKKPAETGQPRFEHYVRSGQKLLRCGYTTGTCAALGAAGAARLLLTGRTPETVALRTPKGIVVEVEPIFCRRSGEGAECAIRKDGGDDVDVTTGLPVIADIKRGDIGSTSEAYAVGHLGKVQVGSKSYYGFDEDFVTVNPYLGSDGVNPFVKICKEEKKGIFVLVKTSNPSSGEFQDQLVNGRPLYELVGEKVAAWGADCMGDSYSYVGAVVGATYPEQGKVLRKIMPKAFILVPGYGAQGGKGADLVHFFNEDRLGAIINSSRGIIAAYQQEKYAQFGEQNYADASRAAVLDMREDIAQALAAR